MSVNSQIWKKFILIGLAFLCIGCIASFHIKESPSENRIECSPVPEEIAPEVPPYILLMREERKQKEEERARESEKMMREQTEECIKPFVDFMEYLEGRENLNQKKHASNLP